MKKTLTLLSLMASAAAAYGQNSLTSGTSVLFRGSTNLGTFPTQEECKSYGR